MRNTFDRVWFIVEINIAFIFVLLLLINTQPANSVFLLPMCLALPMVLLVSDALFLVLIAEDAITDLFKRVTKKKEPDALG
jgi:glucose-6-phosphate-specific signal transduction histidine kinase